MNKKQDIVSILDFKNIDELKKQCQLQFLQQNFKILSKTGYFLLKSFIQFNKKYTLKQIIITLKTSINKQQLVSQIIQFNIQFFNKQKQLIKKLDEAAPLFKQNTQQQKLEIKQQKHTQNNQLNINNMNILKNDQALTQNKIIELTISNILSKTRSQYNINDFLKYVMQLQTYFKNFNKIKEQGLQKTKQLLQKQITNIILNLNRKTFIRLTDLQSEKIAIQLSTYLFNN